MLSFPLHLSCSLTNSQNYFKYQDTKKTTTNSQNYFKYQDTIPAPFVMQSHKFTKLL